MPGPGTPAPPGAAVVGYRDTLRILGWTSAVAMDLALGFSLTIAWIAGVSKGEISDGTKRGMFIFATVFLAVGLVFFFFFLSLFRVLIFFFVEPTTDHTSGLFPRVSRGLALPPKLKRAA